MRVWKWSVSRLSATGTGCHPHPPRKSSAERKHLLLWYGSGTIQTHHSNNHNNCSPTSFYYNILPHYTTSMQILQRAVTSSLGMMITASCYLPTPTQGFFLVGRPFWSRRVASSSSSALDMIKNRGLEVRREGATPTGADKETHGRLLLSDFSSSHHTSLGPHSDYSTC